MILKKCPKCGKELMSIDGYTPSGAREVDYSCKCGYTKTETIDETPKIKIKMGKTPAETKIFLDNKEISNCESFLISATPNECKAYISILHFPTELELSDWETSFKLIGTREEQIKTFEALLDKLKNEKVEPPSAHSSPPPNSQDEGSTSKSEDKKS